MRGWFSASILLVLVTLVHNTNVASVNPKNVRTAATRVTLTSAKDAPQRKLQDLRVLHLVPATYFVQGSFQSLYAPGGTEFPVTCQVEQPRGGFVQVSLQGPLNTYQYHINYNNADGWVSSIQLASQTYNTGSQEYVLVENRLRDLVSRSQQLAFEKDGRLQFITDNGSTRVSFNPAKPDGILFHRIVPETYFVRGAFQTLGDMKYPVWIESQRPYGGLIKVVIRGANLYQYQISYNNADGWVSKVEFIDQTYRGEPVEQVVVEKKVLDIVSRVQQIAFEKDDRIQFITDNGNTRVSFDPIRLYQTVGRRLEAKNAKAPERKLQASALYLVPGTYFTKGDFQPLFPGQVEVPVSCQVHRVRDDFVKVVMQGPLNTYEYHMDYSNTDGLVRNVQLASQTSFQGSEEYLAVESRLRDIVSRSQRLFFETDGRLQFITDDGISRVSFDPTRPDNILFHRIVPETYFVRGGFQQLGSMRYPVWIESQRPYGGLIKVVVRGANMYQYQVSYNNADGWVSKVEFIDQTYNAEPVEQVFIEKKILDVVSRVQQIAFEKDGRIQFITDYGSTRVSFDPIRLFQTVARRLEATDESKKSLKVVPETYQVRGTFQQLFSAESFLVTATLTMDGATDIFFELRTGVNVIVYSIKRKGDGWVTQIQKISETHNPVTAEQQKVQQAITDIIDRVQQVSIENSGRVQFITDNAATRISFDPFLLAKDASPRRLQSIDYRSVAAATYMVNGQLQPLFTGAPFPITVATESAGVGVIKVLVRGINMYNYIISYNNADGWVNRVNFIDQTYQQGTLDQMEAERKITSIVSRTQQLAFEKDGRLQFITDSGSTRVSFDMAAFPRFLQAGETISSPTVSLSPFDMMPPTGPNVPTGGMERITSPTVSLSPFDMMPSVGMMPTNVMPGGEQHTLKLAPETYMVNGQLQQLFDGPSFLVTMKTTLNGNQITVELHCMNIAVYLFGRQAQDGWVTSRRLVTETHNQVATPSQRAVQQKLMDIIGQAEQIAIEQDGRTQFITSSGKTRVSFDKLVLAGSIGATPNIPISHFPDTTGLKVLKLVPSTYMRRGNFEKLFSNETPFLVTAKVKQNGSEMMVELDVGQNYVLWTFTRQGDGWITNKRQISESHFGMSSIENFVKSRLEDIIGNAEQISIESDGRTQFITESGKTRVSFDPFALT